MCFQHMLQVWEEEQHKVPSNNITLYTFRMVASHMIVATFNCGFYGADWFSSVMKLCPLEARPLQRPAA